jgi:hypothetical protein
MCRPWILIIHLSRISSFFGGGDFVNFVGGDELSTYLICWWLEIRK